MTGKKILSAAMTLTLLLVAGLFLSDPMRYAACVLKGVSLWAVNVLPVTFPFLFFTALLTRLSLFGKVARKIAPAARLFGVSGEGGCAAVLAALSGYPVGARETLDLHEQGVLKGKEVFRLACLATTSGPAFLIGTVGGTMLSAPKMGAVMLLCHFLGVWTVCLFLRRGETAPSLPARPSKRGGNVLYDSIFQSVLSILFVGGSIALFYLFGQMLLDFLPPLPPYVEGVLRGLIEMTAGAQALCREATPLHLGTCCFLVTFGGACVLCQQLSFLMTAGVRPLPFLAVKLLQGLLAGLYCFLACLILF